MLVVQTKTKHAIGDFLPIVTVVIVGLALSIAVFILVRAHYVAADKQRFQRDVAYYSSNFKSDIDRHVTSLAAIHAFVSSTQAVNRWEFSAFADEILPQNAGFRTVLWLPLVSRAQRWAFESNLQKDGLYGLQIRELTQTGHLETAGVQASYLPVAFVAPIDGTVDLIGLDLSKNPIYAPLFLTAQKAGRIVASRPIVSALMNKAAAPSVLVVLPLDKGSHQDEKTSSDLEGYIVGVLQLDRVIDESIGPEAPIQAAITYGSQSNPAAPVVGQRIPISGSQRGFYDSRFYQTVPFSIAGQHFHLMLYSKPYNDPLTRFYVPIGTASLLIALSALLAQSMLTNILRRREVEVAVIRRTSELRNVNKALSDEVDQRRQAETALLAAKEKAESANRAKSAFLSTMSHELRTPLNAIIGFSGILGQKAPVSEERFADYLHEIHGSGIKLLELINDILDITQMDAEESQTGEMIYIPDIIDAAIAKMAAVAEKRGVKLRSKVVDQLPFLHGDSRRLQRGLTHLISNAIKFTDRGGWALVSARADANVLILEVSDNGIGMPYGAEAKIAGYFAQYDNSLARKHDGSGLGLTFVRRVADIHNAVLRIVSKPGEGTNVSVAFPAHRLVKASEVA